MRGTSRAATRWMPPSGPASTRWGGPRAGTSTPAASSSTPPAPRSSRPEPSTRTTSSTDVHLERPGGVLQRGDPLPGSPWGRPGRSNFRVRFEDDRRFRGMKAVNLSSRGGAPNDGAAHYLIRHGGGSEKPVPVPDYRYIRMWVNGGYSGTFGILQPTMATSWRSGTARRPPVLSQGIGPDPLQRRRKSSSPGRRFLHPHGPRHGELPGILHPLGPGGRDDWEPFMALSKVMDTRTSGTVAFDAAIGTVLDVEEFLRCWGSIACSPTGTPSAWGTATTAT